MNKYFILLSLVLMISISFAETLDIYFFYGESCPHCAKVKPLLDEMEAKYIDQIEVHRYEVYNDKENSALFKEFLNKYDISSSGVPALFVVDEFLVGSKQIPDNLENIIIKNINSETQEETIIPDKENINLNEIKESDDSMLGFWGFIQNPFILLIIILILVIFAYEMYKITNQKTPKNVKNKPKKSTKPKRKTSKKQTAKKSKTKRTAKKQIKKKTVKKKKRTKK